MSSATEHFHQITRISNKAAKSSQTRLSSTTVKSIDVTQASSALGGLRIHKLSAVSASSSEFVPDNPTSSEFETKIINDAVNISKAPDSLGGFRILKKSTENVSKISSNPSTTATNGDVITTERVVEFKSKKVTDGVDKAPESLGGFRIHKKSPYKEPESVSIISVNEKLASTQILESTLAASHVVPESEIISSPIKVPYDTPSKSNGSGYQALSQAASISNNMLNGLSNQNVLPPTYLGYFPNQYTAPQTDNVFQPFPPYPHHPFPQPFYQSPYYAYGPVPPPMYPIPFAGVMPAGAPLHQSARSVVTNRTVSISTKSSIVPAKVVMKKSD